jgi:hypothetical protein
MSRERVVPRAGKRLNRVRREKSCEGIARRLGSGHGRGTLPERTASALLYSGCSLPSPYLALCRNHRDSWQRWTFTNDARKSGAHGSKPWGMKGRAH